jgi:hypothetical protein
MELVKHIQYAKQLNFSQLCKFKDMIQSYEHELHDVMQIIYQDLMIYFSTYLRQIAIHVHTYLQDPSKQKECEDNIHQIKHHLEVTMLEPIQDKLKHFIHYQSLEYIKMVTLYFMLHIPMIVHLYSEKIEHLYRLMDRQKRLR